MIPEEPSDRQRQLYWKELLAVKVDACYFRRYRDHVGKRVHLLAALKAVTSSAGIAAWAIWAEYAFVWGVIIALSQLADALKDVFPFARIHKATSECAVLHGSMFIDAQFEWENIFADRYKNDEIMQRTYALRKLRLETQAKSFPQGLPCVESLLAAAESEASAYLRDTYLSI
jgi:hypothetical protein